MERDKIREYEIEIENSQLRKIDKLCNRNEFLEKQNDEIIYEKVE